MFSRKDLTRLIIPLIVEQVFVATIGIADTLMVSQVGEAAVSGVALVDAVNSLLINIFTALATGGAIITAQYLGKEDEEGANRSAKQLVLVTLLFSALIMAVSLAANSPILTLLYGRVEPDVMSNARVYFYLSALSYPFIAIFNSCAALFRCMNNARVPMFASGLMNVINIIGNAILIYGFQMGAAGAALASLASRAVGAVLLFGLLHKPRYVVTFEHFFPLRLEFDTIKKILKIGVPNGLESGMFHIGKIMVQGIVTAFGTTAIAANAVAANIASLSMLGGNSISLASITVVGRCVGAHDYKQASHYMKKLTAISQVLVTGIYAVIILVMNPIISLYDLSPAGTEIARQMIICVAITGVLFWSVAFVLPSGLRSANDVNFTMVIAITSMWVFRVGGGYLFSNQLGFGALGVWIGMGTDWLFRAIVFTIRYLSGRWKHKQII